MKERLFPVFMGICFLLGVVVFLTSGPQTDTPVEMESVQEQETDEPTEMSETEAVDDVAPTTETGVPPQASTFGIDANKLKELLKTNDLENFKGFENPEDAQEFTDKLKSLMSAEALERMEAAEKWFSEKFDGITPGEVPDIDMQELYDIMGLPINFAEIGMKVFRQHFPEGTPADYEAQMATRIHEIVAATPGDFHEVMTAVAVKLHKEQDFTAWTLAQFQGKIGQQIEWMRGEIIAAGALEGVEYSDTEDMSEFIKSFAGTMTQGPAMPALNPQDTVPQTDTVNASPTSTNSDSGHAPNPATAAPAPLSPARVAKIREVLLLHGTEAGMLRLLETDKEAAGWILKQFDTPAKIEAWLSGQTAGSPPAKPPARQPAPKPGRK